MSKNEPKSSGAGVVAMFYYAKEGWHAAVKKELVPANDNRLSCNVFQAQLFLEWLSLFSPHGRDSIDTLIVGCVPLSVYDPTSWHKHFRHLGSFDVKTSGSIVRIDSLPEAPSILATLISDETAIVSRSAGTR